MTACPPATMDAAALDNVTVLVVDDEEDMRLIVKAFLERAGLRVVEEAADGLDALQVVDRLSPPPIPTVIVLDNRMPGLSGLEVARDVLTRLPAQRIVLFSAFLSPEIEEEALDLGIRVCVSKSDVNRLAEIVAGVAADAA